MCLYHLYSLYANPTQDTVAEELSRVARRQLAAASRSSSVNRRGELPGRRAP
jgi:hypothetical protein